MNRNSCCGLNSGIGQEESTTCSGTTSSCTCSTPYMGLNQAGCSPMFSSGCSNTCGNTCNNTGGTGCGCTCGGTIGNSWGGCGCNNNTSCGTTCGTNNCCNTWNTCCCTPCICPEPIILAEKTCCTHTVHMHEQPIVQPIDNRLVHHHRFAPNYYTTQRFSEEHVVEENPFRTNRLL